MMAADSAKGIIFSQDSCSPAEQECEERGTQLVLTLGSGMRHAALVP